MFVSACSETSRSVVRRPGVTTAGLLIGTTLLLAVAALSLDMAMLMMTTQEAQSACDAAALAGASQLWDETLLGGLRQSEFSTSKFERGVAGVERSEPPVGRISGGSLRSTPATQGLGTANLEVLEFGMPTAAAAQVQDAVSQARSLASTNTVAGEPVILDETRDIEVTLPQPNGDSGWIQVTCPFTAARGNPLRRVIGSLLGAADVDAVIRSRAALDQRVYGFQPAGATSVPLAPLVVDPEGWISQVESGWIALTFSATAEGVDSPVGDEAFRKSECTLCTLSPSGGDETQATTGEFMGNEDQVDLGLHARDLQPLGGRFALDASGALELLPSLPADAATVAWMGARLELAAKQQRCLIWPLGRDVVDANTKQVFRQISGFSAGIVNGCGYDGVANTLTIQVTPVPLITSTALVRPGQPRNPWIAKVHLLP